MSTAATTLTTASSGTLDEVVLEDHQKSLQDRQSERNFKEELEAEKIRLEIENLRRWWTQPAYIQAIFGTVIAFGAVMTGYATNWFQVQQKSIENQLHDLGDKRSELQKSITELANTGAVLSARLATTQSALDREAKARQQASDALNAEKQRTEQFSSELAELRKSAGRSDATVKSQIESLNNRWSAIVKAREAENESYRKQLEQSKHSGDVSGNEPAKAGLPSISSSTPATSFANEFQQPVFASDTNSSAEALFRANATPAMLEIYNKLPPDQQRAMQVQAVLNHLEQVNKTAQEFMKWDKETLMKTARDIS